MPCFNRGVHKIFVGRVPEIYDVIDWTQFEASRKIIICLKNGNSLKRDDIMELQNMGERVFAAECIQKKRIRKVYKCWVCPSNWQYYYSFLQVLAFVQKNTTLLQWKVWIIFSI